MNEDCKITKEQLNKINILCDNIEVKGRSNVTNLAVLIELMTHIQTNQKVLEESTGGE